MKTWRRAGLYLGISSLVTAGAVNLAMPAQAAASSSAIVKTGGTRAGEAWFNRSNGTHSNKAWFDVYDAKCDAEPVYVQYSINGDLKDYTQENDGGCGTTMGVNLQTGYFTIKYRVCVDNGVFSDSCSSWKSDHN
ncbi:hypothetical protein Sru01_26920 [Sphaerisporangium rufum]|uniref:Secreted protein n=1 Tax=Sphaerisporangium rufum TaxID=1381558 RepID=A0A919R3J4_9ACTN|nr:hypothetical protein Sru01_26920 [Sphaerisporangium rufum]